MKKSKIIASLSSLGVVASAAPIVATSCTSSQQGPFSLDLTTKLNNKIAYNSTAKTDFTAVDKNHNIVKLENVIATADNAGIRILTMRLTTASTSKSWTLEIVATANVSVGEKFTYNIEAYDQDHNKVNYKQEMTVVNHDYKMTLVGNSPIAYVNQYGMHPYLMTDPNGVNGFIAITDAGNIAWDVLNKIGTGSGELIWAGKLNADIFDSNGDVVVNDKEDLYSGIAISLFHDLNDTDAPENPYIRYTITAYSNPNIDPILGEYTLKVSIPWIEETSLSFKFTVKPGMHIEGYSGNNITIWQESLFNCENFIAGVLNIDLLTEFKFRLAPGIKRTDTLEYKFVPYGDTKELPNGMGFGTIDQTDNSCMLYVPANALKNINDYFQFKVIAYVNNNERASANILYRKNPSH